jgi:hypothetical protein
MFDSIDGDRHAGSTDNERDLSILLSAAGRRRPISPWKGPGWWADHSYDGSRAEILVWTMH